MKKTYVDEIPQRRRYRTRYWVDTIEELHRSDEKILKIEIEPGDYKHPSTAQVAAKRAISQSGYRMEATTVNGALYIFKLD